MLLCIMHLGKEMEFRFDTLKAADYPAVLALWRQAELSLSTPDEREGFETVLARNPTTCLGLWDGDRLAACVQGTWDGRRAYVNHLAVDLAYRRQGLGTRLMVELIDRFRDLGVTRAHLFIEARNPHLQTYYEALGWFKRDLTMMSIDL
jgi:N-acetylglutamate synthase